MRWSAKLLSASIGGVVSWALVGGIAWVVPVSAWHGNYPVTLMASVALAASLTPALLRRTFHIALPWELEFLVVLQLNLHTYWGVWRRFYDLHGYWDDLLHFQGTLIVSFIGFLCVYSLHFSGRARMSGPLFGLFTVAFGNALGAWWEIVEFTVDKTLHKNTQYGLDNTMWDLINNFLGSLLAAGFGWLYVRYSRPLDRRRLAQPLASLLGRLLPNDDDSAGH
jgi:hypothetical protein